MPNILLLDLDPDIADMMGEVLKPDGYALEEITFAQAGRFMPSKGYDILFCEPPFGDVRRMEAVCGLKTRLKDCLVVFVLKAFDKEMAKTCYMQGDGSIVLPMEPDKLRRITAWYVSAEHMKESEHVKERRTRSVPAFRAALQEYRGFVLVMVLAVLVLGAVIGFFFADQPRERTGTSQVPVDRIKGALNEIRK